MDNSKQPAFPALDFNAGPNVLELRYEGLSKREYYAALAMQGYIAAGVHGVPEPGSLADYSVKAADALLLELSKHPTP